jgi:hypothetical protein
MMKQKHKATTSPARQRRTTSSGDGHRGTRQRMWLWLAAVFLVLTLFASECAALFPLE